MLHVSIQSLKGVYPTAILKNKEENEEENEEMAESTRSADRLFDADSIFTSAPLSQISKVNSRLFALFEQYRYLRA